MDMVCNDWFIYCKKIRFQLRKRERERERERVEFLFIISLVLLLRSKWIKFQYSDHRFFF
jgi:hypothetical protein